jgi:hypothetical protein
MATDNGRHREIRLFVKRVLEDRFEAVRSSHENGNLVLYSLLGGRPKGNTTTLKEPDVIAYDENMFLIVEVETSDRPSTILGDVASVDAATHCALSPDEEPRPLPQCKVAVVIDSESLKEGSSKLEQFDLLEEAYRPFGAVGEFRVLTEKSFVSYIERLRSE